MPLAREERRRLIAIAHRIRQHVIGMAAVRRAHIGPALSLAEILTVLYFRHLRVDPRAPDAPGRDRFILSKGHGVLALFAVLAEAGFLPPEELARFGQPGSPLAGHPTEGVRGIDVATGSLGHGLSIGAGLALAGRADGSSFRTVVVLGDGELNEGSVWEAALFAAHWSLDRLVAIIDRNGYQQEGPTARILQTEPLAGKWREFGWNVLEAEGHDLDDLDRALDAAEHARGRPSVIIAATVKGKGVSFMEGQPDWHMAWLRGEDLQRALSDLERGAGHE
jgi:transketolase